MRDLCRLAVVICVVFVMFLGVITAGCGGGGVIDGQVDGTKNSGKNYSWMTMNLPWQGMISIPLIGKGYRKDSDEPDIALNAESNFTIYLTLGSSEYRIYNVVAVRSDGVVIAAYKNPESYRYYQKKFNISRDAVDRLRKVLIKNKAGQMLASSIDPEIDGGVQGGFTIKSDGLIRRSYFSNSWPESFRNITDYICEDILRYNSATDDNGFTVVTESIITVDPEATYAIRGLLKGK